MRITILLLFLLPYQAFGQNNPASLMPLPNTEYISACNKQVRILRTGTLVATAKAGAPANKKIQYSMNAQFIAGSEIRKLRMEPWNRFAFVSSIAQAGDKYTEVKIVSGNLEDVTLTIGSAYSGQISERVMEKGETKTTEWQVNIKIESLSKTTFKKESLVTYRIKTTRSQITGGSAVISVDAIYAPKIGQFLNMTQKHSAAKNLFVCSTSEIKHLDAKK